MSSAAPATTEIAFRLAVVDGQVKVDSRIGPADQQGLTPGWSHMTTEADGYDAADARAQEIKYQLGQAGIDVFKSLTVGEAYQQYLLNTARHSEELAK